MHEVVEIANIEAHVRGKLKDGGWISLMDLTDGQQFVSKVASRQRAESFCSEINEYTVALEGPNVLCNAGPPKEEIKSPRSRSAAATREIQQDMSTAVVNNQKMEYMLHVHVNMYKRKMQLQALKSVVRTHEAARHRVYAAMVEWSRCAAAASASSWTQVSVASVDTVSVLRCRELEEELERMQGEMKNRKESKGCWAALMSEEEEEWSPNDASGYAQVSGTSSQCSQMAEEKEWSRRGKSMQKKRSCWRDALTRMRTGNVYPDSD